METYLTIEGLADYLKVAEKTLRKWVLNREIPYRKIMKVIRFRVSEIEAWIDAGCFALLTENNRDSKNDLFNSAVSPEEITDNEIDADEETHGGEA